MKKNIFVSLIVVCCMILLYPINTMASISKSNSLEVIENIVEKGTFTDEEVEILEKELANLEVSSSTYFTLEEGEAQARGYGQTHNLGKGWKVRVDKPHIDGVNSKPHVHVTGPNGKKCSENVDGTNSHNSNLNKGKVPSDIKKRIKNLKDYKKGQSDLAKMKKAKSQIQSKKLNLKKAVDVVKAIAIFVAVVGLVLIATTNIWGWAALLIAI